MSRPEQVLLVLVVFANGVAAATARGPVSATGVATGAGALLATAVSVHVANEWADADTDALTRRTAFSGGSGALADLGLRPRVALAAALAAGAAAVVAGVLGALAGALTPAALALLLTGLAGGWQYSVAPLALKRRGWGEVANAVLGGLLLPVYGVAAARGATGVADVLVFVPFTLLVFANLLETQRPDREADRAVGARTLVTRLSPRAVRALAAGVSVLAHASVAVLAVALREPALAAAGAVALPLSAWSLARITRVERPLPAVLAMVAFVLTSGSVWAARALG